MAIVGRTATVFEINDTDLTGTIQGTLPAGLQYGDVLIACFIGSCSVANFVRPATEWVQFVAPFYVPDNDTQAAYYRVHTQASPITAGPIFGYSGGARQTVIMQAYSGVNNSTPMDVTATTAVTNPYAASIAAPSVTTVTAGAMLISAGLVDSATAIITKPGTMTLVADASGGGTGRGGALAEEARPTVGATGTRTWTTTASYGMSTWLCALRPQTGLLLTGTMAAAGSLRRLTSKRFAGSSTPSGAWSYLKVVERAFSGTIEAIGSFSKTSTKLLTGTVVASSTLARVTAKRFAGSVAAAGSVLRYSIRTFVGSITPSGTFSYIALGRAAGRPGRAVLKLIKAGEAYLRVRRN